MQFKIQASEAVQSFYELQEKTINFAITNEANVQEALKVWSNLNDNFQEISESYNFVYFTGKLSKFIDEYSDYSE